MAQSIDARSAVPPAKQTQKKLTGQPKIERLWVLGKVDGAA
jgi:hypothetical protein